MTPVPYYSYRFAVTLSKQREIESEWLSWVRDAGNWHCTLGSGPIDFCGVA